MFKIIPLLILSVTLIGVGGVAISFQKIVDDTTSNNLQNYMCVNKNINLGVQNNPNLFLKANTQYVLKGNLIDRSCEAKVSYNKSESIDEIRKGCLSQTDKSICVIKNSIINNFFLPSSNVPTMYDSRAIRVDIKYECSSKFHFYIF